MLSSTADTFMMLFASWSLTALMTDMVIAFIVWISSPFEGEPELLLPPQEKAKGKHWPSRGLGKTKNLIPKFFQKKHIYYMTKQGRIFPKVNLALGATSSWELLVTCLCIQHVVNVRQCANGKGMPTHAPWLESQGETGLCCLNISPKSLYLQSLSFYSNSRE